MLLLLALVGPVGVKPGLFTARIFPHQAPSDLLPTQKVAHFSFHLPLCSVRFLTANQKAFIFFSASVKKIILFVVKVLATYRIAWAIQLFLIRFCFSGVEIKKKNQLLIITICLSLYPVFSLYIHQV